MNEATEHFRAAEVWAKRGGDARSYPFADNCARLALAHAELAKVAVMAGQTLETER